MEEIIKENNNKEKSYLTVNAQVEGALMAVISVVLGLLTLVPLLGILALAGPVPSILLVLRRGVRVGFLAALVAGCVFSFFAGFQAGIIFVINFNLVGLTLGLGIKRKWSVTNIIIAGSLVCFIYMVISVLALPLLMGQDLGKLLDEAKNQVIEIYKQIGIPEEQLEKLSEQVDFNLILIKKMFITLLFLSSICTIFIQYLIAQMILKKLGYTMPDVPPFKSWKLPWHYAWIFIIGFLLMYIGSSQESHSTIKDFLKNPPQNRLFIIGINLYWACMMAYVIVGFSIAYYFLDRFKLHKINKIIIMIIAFLFLGNIMMFFGLLDTWFDFRKIDKGDIKNETGRT